VRGELWDRAKITSHFGIPSPGHLGPILNRKILEIVLLLLRFCSIGSTKPDPDLGANSVKLFLRGPYGVGELPPGPSRRSPPVPGLGRSAASSVAGLPPRGRLAVPDRPLPKRTPGITPSSSRSRAPCVQTPAPDRVLQQACKVEVDLSWHAVSLPWNELVSQ
jgi:hypothetical protein